MRELQSKRLSFKALLLAFLFAVTLSHAEEQVFQPKAQKVVANVYAIVGPLGQRSTANAGLNANYGFVVTTQGVILIDSGASAYSAALLEKAIGQVTNQPIRWVLNTGSQDHRWLGNAYFASRGAQVHALAGTAQTQKASVEQQISGLARFVGDQIKGTVAFYANVIHPGSEASMNIAGVPIQWIDGHIATDDRDAVPGPHHLCHVVDASPQKNACAPFVQSQCTGQ